MAERKAHNKYLEKKRNERKRNIANNSKDDSQCWCVPNFSNQSHNEPISYLLFMRRQVYWRFDFSHRLRRDAAHCSRGDFICLIAQSATNRFVALLQLPPLSLSICLNVYTFFFIFELIFFLFSRTLLFRARVCYSNTNTNVFGCCCLENEQKKNKLLRLMKKAAMLRSATYCCKNVHLYQFNLAHENRHEFLLGKYVKSADTSHQHEIPLCNKTHGNHWSRHYNKETLTFLWWNKLRTCHFWWHADEWARTRVPASDEKSPNVRNICVCTNKQTKKKLYMK